VAALLERFQVSGFSEVQVHHQFESGEADRINNTPERIGQSGSSYPMTSNLKSKIENPKSIGDPAECAGAGG
jgi:hypothetical protein